MGCNFLGIQFVALLFVHPHTGVWVEMRLTESAVQASDVHPHTGVWVEMINQEYSKLYQISSSPCGGVG